MSSSTRTLFGVIVIVAIVTAWTWVGCLTLEKRIPDWPRAQAVLRRVGFACGLIAGLTFFNGMGGLLTLVLLTGTPPDRSESHVFGIPVPTPRWLERLFIGTFAVVLDVFALLSWIAAGAGLVQLLRGKEPPAA